MEEAGVLCPSMYSYHSSPEEKNKLLLTLAEYGIETTVDRVAKKDRIKEWIQNSTLEEEADDVESEEKTKNDDFSSALESQSTKTSLRSLSDTKFTNR